MPTQPTNASTERADAALSEELGGAGRSVAPSRAEAGAERDAGAQGAAMGGMSAADAAGVSAAAGAGPTPNASAGVGGGDATTEASGEAGAGGEAAETCGDTTSDIAHCGRCDNDCNATRALVSCEASRCVRACAPGYGDCNLDLAFGRQGDGCEVDLSSDLTHCGACGSRCEPPLGTIGFCEARQCQLHAVQVGDAAPVGPLHGTADGGDAYDQICGRDEALVGIDVASDGSHVLGFAARCAPLWLTGSQDAMAIDAGPARVLPALGNRVGAMVPPVTLDCPTGMLMSGVSGATAFFGADNTLLSIKALALSCARTHIADSSVALEPSSMPAAGSWVGEVLETFVDECPEGHAVVGFSGRAGYLIDGLATLCAPVWITQRSQ